MNPSHFQSQQGLVKSLPHGITQRLTSASLFHLSGLLWLYWAHWIILKNLSMSRSSTESHLPSPKGSIFWGRGSYHSKYHDGVPPAWKVSFSAWKSPTQFLRHSLKSHGNVTIFMRPLLFLQPKGLIPKSPQFHVQPPLLQHLLWTIVYLSSSMSRWLGVSHCLIHFCSLRGLTIKDCWEEKWIVIFWREKTSGGGRHKTNKFRGLLFWVQFRNYFWQLLPGYHHTINQTP